jgi:general secretion pathway protein D
VKDPNPSLAIARVESNIPETQTREMESVLKVGSGQTAILGGLMIDSFVGSTSGLPLASRIPLIGDLVSFRNDKATKSELVIFIRPFVVRDASLEGDLAEYKRFLPGAQFFRDTERPLTQEFEKGVRDIERGNWPNWESKPVPVVPEPPPPERRP